jgi:hypothetical protein
MLPNKYFVFVGLCSFKKQFRDLILSLFFDQLSREEKLYEHFMQQNVISHNAKNPVFALNEVFGERVHSRGLWLL